MQIYRLTPAAPMSDPGWTLAAFGGEVLVRAETPAQARVIAARAQAEGLSSDQQDNDDVFSVNASAFTNEKLYAVVIEPEPDHDPDGPPGVLERRGEAEPIPRLKAHI